MTGEDMNERLAFLLSLSPETIARMTHIELCEAQSDIWNLFTEAEAKQRADESEISCIKARHMVFFMELDVRGDECFACSTKGRRENPGQGPPKFTKEQRIRWGLKFPEDVNDGDSTSASSELFKAESPCTQEHAKSEHACMHAWG
jgi:hypothetical protein